MLRINVLLESGDASQESFDRHIPNVRHAVSGVNEVVRGKGEVTPGTVVRTLQELGKGLNPELLVHVSDSTVLDGSIWKAISNC